MKKKLVCNNTYQNEGLDLTRDELLQLIHGCAGMLQGTLVTLYRKCGKKGCRCEQGEKHGPAHYLSYKEDGKTKMIYIPVYRLEDVKEAMEAFSKYWELGVRLARLNLKQMGLIGRPKFEEASLMPEIKDGIAISLKEVEQKNKDKSEYTHINRILELNSFLKAVRDGAEVDDS